MNMNVDRHIPIQVYAKEICGIQYLKTIGIYRTETNDIVFNWKEVSACQKDSEEIKLYMHGKRVYLIGWEEHIWGDEKRTVTLTNVHLIF